jgi:transposase
VHYIGVDLHKRTLVAAVETGYGPVGRPVSIGCQDTDRIRAFFEARVPFRAVIEASASYRWLYDLVADLGDVLLAHPARLRAIVSGRAKTDKLDAKLLAGLLRADLIPPAYVPPQPYATLREVTRARARLARHAAQAKNELHALLIRVNVHAPYRDVFSQGGRRWLAAVPLGEAGSFLRDELLRRTAYYDQEIAALDARLDTLAVQFPQTAALCVLHGIGLYSALLIVGEIGEPWRFANGRQVGAYAGLTARVSQSGTRAYHGHITRQGSPWLRWSLVQAAMHIVRKDPELKNLYTRIRKRSSAQIARVAAARKLATICWVRLMRWHAAQMA